MGNRPKHAVRNALLIPVLLSILLIDVAVRRVAWNWHAIGQWCVLARERINVFCTIRSAEPLAVVGALCRAKREMTEQRDGKQRERDSAAARQTSTRPSLPPTRFGPPQSTAFQIEPLTTIVANSRGAYVGNLMAAKQRARQIIHEQEKRP